MGPPNSDALRAHGRRRETPKNKTSLHDDIGCAQTYNIANSQAQHNRTESRAPEEAISCDETRFRRAGARLWCGKGALNNPTHHWLRRVLKWRKVSKARKTVPKQNLEEVTMTVVTACRVFFPSLEAVHDSLPVLYGHMYNKIWSHVQQDVGCLITKFEISKCHVIMSSQLCLQIWNPWDNILVTPELR